jgi:hypothetical protein
VAWQLLVSTVGGVLVNEGWDGDGDPVILGSGLATGALRRAWLARATGPLGRDEAEAIGVGGAGADGVSQDVVDDGRGTRGVVPSADTTGRN